MFENFKKFLKTLRNSLNNLSSSSEEFTFLGKVFLIKIQQTWRALLAKALIGFKEPLEAREPRIWQRCCTMYFK